jgi:predicted branched-subunit amino acid permease
MSPDFLAGVRRSIPILVSTAPFGLLYGAIAVDQGLTVWQASLMSLTIYAGASQLVGIDLFKNHAAPWLVILSIFIVNSRHILYSAAVGRRIGHFPASSIRNLPKPSGMPSSRDMSLSRGSWASLCRSM